MASLATDPKIMAQLANSKAASLSSGYTMRVSA